MNSLIETGNELVTGRETVAGASTIKLQLESTKSRWEGIENQATSRQQLLEDTLVKTFQADVYKILAWIQDKEMQLEHFDIMMQIEDLDAYAQVSFHCVLF